MPKLTIDDNHCCCYIQGVIAELREDNVIRSVREDSESSCVGEIAFFMGIAQPRTFQVGSSRPSCACVNAVWPTPPPASVLCELCLSSAVSD